LDRWTDYLECGGQIDAVYTDFEKAFDKVPYRRLISKIYSYGINEIVINWISDFLTARKFRFKVNLSNCEKNSIPLLIFSRATPTFANVFSKPD